MPATTYECRADGYRRSWYPMRTEDYIGAKLARELEVKLDPLTFALKDTQSRQNNLSHPIVLRRTRCSRQWITICPRENPHLERDDSVDFRRDVTSASRWVTIR